MAGRRQTRPKIALECGECSQRNYWTTKARPTGERQERLKLKKYCPACNCHTEHRESN